MNIISSSRMSASIAWHEAMFAHLMYKFKKITLKCWAKTLPLGSDKWALDKVSTEIQLCIRA